MARTPVGTAIAGLGQFSIRSNAGLSMNAPEQAIAGSGQARVQISDDELPFPAEGWTEIGMASVETIGG